MEFRPVSGCRVRFRFASGFDLRRVLIRAGFQLAWDFNWREISRQRGNAEQSKVLLQLGGMWKRRAYAALIALRMQLVLSAPWPRAPSVRNGARPP